MATLRGWVQAVRAALTRPGAERFEAVLLLKAAVATVLAWQLAVRLFDSPAPFYAPMAALLVVTWGPASSAHRRVSTTAPPSPPPRRLRPPDP